MAISDGAIKDALKAVKYPGFSRDIVSFGLVKGIQIDGGAVTVQLALATNEPAIPQAIKTEAEQILRALPGVENARVLIDIHAPPAGAGAAGIGTTRIEGIKHVIAIATFMVRASRSCLGHAIGPRPRRKTGSSRSSNTISS